jgi:hypothetical protein
MRRVVLAIIRRKVGHEKHASWGGGLGAAIKILCFRSSTSILLGLEDTLMGITNKKLLPSVSVSRI